MSAKVLIERLKSHGVTFRYEPIRAHRQYHGNLSDTFLVDEKFRTVLFAMYGGQKFCEVGVEPETGCRRLAKMKVFVHSDDNFSGSGKGLWLASRPDIDFWGRDNTLFVMEP